MYSYHSSTPNDWSSCTRCRLHSTRRNVVVRRSGYIFNRDIVPLQIDTTPFNQDQRNAVTQALHLNKHQPTPPFILFIGEAPGQSEDMQGQPFVGSSYQPLTNIMYECCQPHPNYWYLRPEYPAHLHRQYQPIGFFFTITNTVCCRPIHTPDTTANPKLHGNNRPPTDAEQSLCEPHLLELLSTYNYTHIVCLGEIAEARYTSISKQFRHNLPHVHLKHPAWFLRQDYQLLDIIKAGKALRDLIWPTT